MFRLLQKYLLDPLTDTLHPWVVIQSNRRKFGNPKLAQRTRFAQYKTYIEHTLSDLQKSNHDFLTLSNQILQQKQSRTGKEKFDAKSLAHKVERYRLIGKASQQFYETLCRACNKCTEHLAVICTEARLGFADHDILVRLLICFTPQNDRGPSAPAPLRFAIEATSTTALLPCTSGNDMRQNQRKDDIVDRRKDNSNALLYRV